MPATALSVVTPPSELLWAAEAAEFQYSTVVAGLKRQVLVSLCGTTYWPDVVLTHGRPDLDASLPDSMKRAPGFDTEPDEFDHVVVHAYDDDDYLSW